MQMQNDSSPSERRSSYRVPVDLGATLHCDSFFYSCRVVDLSEAGLKITIAGCALEVGRQIAVAFPIDGEVIMARGDVRWTYHGGAGVSLSYPSTFERLMVKAFCRKRGARSGAQSSSTLSHEMP